LQLGLSKLFHPHIWYIDSYLVQTVLLEDIIIKYPDINVNFVNINTKGSELKVLQGMSKYFGQIDYIYLEVNYDFVYQDCAIVNDIDVYLVSFNIVRVETKWIQRFRWGHALYVRKDLLQKDNVR
jgi:hypothetical protein